jgi:UDP-N-acetylglucosamine:LPS N-acetylglucosamine transferase
MGYGHLRAAWALADRLEVPVTRVDRPPIARPGESRLWGGVRHAYEQLSRLAQSPVAGWAFLKLLDRITRIEPIGPPGSALRPDLAARRLDRLIEQGMGSGLAGNLVETEKGLLTTFYAPALAVDRLADVPVHCVVTDTDIHRVWAPLDGTQSRIRYLVPTRQAFHRLLAYGVRRDAITHTGFPLPPELEDRSEALLDRRLQRLRGEPDSDPPRVTFAVGGAGAQDRRARQILRALSGALRTGTITLTLVAGTRKAVARRFRRWCSRELGGNWNSFVEIIEEEDFESYYRAFNRTLERTDALWTKPSELVFYAALGLPLILDDPVGSHEHGNARWILEAGAGVVRPKPEALRTDIEGWIGDGTFAKCATAGFRALPRGGSAAIAAACSIALNTDLTVS